MQTTDQVPSYTSIIPSGEGVKSVGSSEAQAMKEILDPSIFEIKLSLYVLKSETTNFYTFGRSGTKDGNLVKRIVVHHNKVSTKTVPRHDYYPFRKVVWILDLDGLSAYAVRRLNAVDKKDAVKKAEAALKVALEKAFTSKEESVFEAGSEADVLAKCHSFSAEFIQQMTGP